MSLQSTDPIADLLTRIRNAALVGKTEIRVPTSKLKKVVAEQLVKNHYLAGVKVEDGKPRGTLVVKLAKDGENCPITEITRVPSLVVVFILLQAISQRLSKAAASCLSARAKV